MTKLSTFFSLVIIIVLASCATKTPVWTPVGNWDYTVKDTPNGDGYGTIIVTEDDDTFKAILRSPEYGDSDITNLTISEGQLKGDLFLAGLDMMISGTFEGDVLTGAVDAGQYGQFPLNASRQAEE